MVYESEVRGACGAGAAPPRGTRGSLEEKSDAKKGVGGMGHPKVPAACPAAWQRAGCHLAVICCCCCCYTVQPLKGGLHTLGACPLLYCKWDRQQAKAAGPRAV